MLARYADLLEDELNVKHVRPLNTAGEAVAYSLNPLPKQLGQKYASRFPAIRKAILDLDPEQAARTLLAGQPLEIALDGERYEIQPDEVEVRAQARSGYAVASEGPYLAALVTELSPELVREGLAREFVRRVQDLRKQADLAISDRIRVHYMASPQLDQAVRNFQDYIQNETLAVELQEAPMAADMVTTTDQFDGEEVTLGIKVKQ